MHNGLHLLDNEPLVECSRNGANYLRRSLVLGNYIGSPNAPDDPNNRIYDGGGIKDFAFNGSKDAKVEVDRTVVRTFGYQSITGYKDFINTVRINHLIVTGQMDTEHVKDVYIGDPLISLNSGNVGDNAFDIGFAMQRGNFSNVAFIWDEVPNPSISQTEHEGGEFALIACPGEQGATKGNVTIEDYLDLRVGNLAVEKESRFKDSLYLTGDNFNITVNNETHDVEQNVLWDIEGDETHEVAGNLKLDIETNYDVEVAGNSTWDIEGNALFEVLGNETHDVEGDLKLDIEGDHTVEVAGDILVTGSNETHNISQDVLWDIEGDETHDIEGGLTQNVAGAVLITGDSITLTSNNETHNVAVDLNYDVEGNVLWDIEGGETHNVNQSVLWDIEQNETHEVAGNLKFDVETNYTVEVAGDETHTVVGDITFGGDEIDFNSRIFDVHTTEQIQLISDKEVIIKSLDPAKDFELRSNKDLILTAVNQVLITGNEGVEITASGDSSITYSGASHLFQVDNADEYDLNSYAEAALQIRNSNTSANQPHALAHFRLDKNGGDGYLGFIAGASANKQEFVLGEQGDEWMRIDTDGNVGVGTNVPVALANQTSLTVNGSQVGRVDLQRNGATKGKLYADSDSFTIDTSASTPLHLATNGADRLTVEAGGNVSVANKFTVGGDLVVNGTTTTVNSTTLQIDDINIELAHSPNGSSVGDASVNGGGITLVSSDGDKTILWQNDNKAWEFSEHVMPSGDNLFDLGKSNQQWRNLYIDGTANIDSLVADTADINGGTVDAITSLTAAGNLDIGAHNFRANSLTADGLTQGRVVFAGANGLLSNDADLTFSGSTLSATNMTSSGTVTYGSLSDGAITITAFQSTLTNGAALVPTSAAVKAYVDAQVTAQDLDFKGDTGGALAIDLDSETLTIAGGTGLASVGSGNTVTLNIDSTVVTKAGTQTLTNKTLTTPTIGDFTNATHDHSNAANGGGIAQAAVTAHEGALSINQAQIPDFGGPYMLASANPTPGAHSHEMGDITGLSAALGGKVDDSQVLTNVPAGAVFTDTQNTYSSGDFSFSGLSDTTITSPAVNQILEYNGSAWVNADPTTAGVTPGGSDTHIQFNDSSALGGSADLTWDGTVLAIGAATAPGEGNSLLEVSGDIVAVGDVFANGTTSDMNLKENIGRISNPLQKIKRLNGFTFDWNEDYGLHDRFKGEKQVGVSAQDVEEVMPELVVNRPNGSKAVKYDQMIPLLIEGMKEQQKQIASLESRLNKKK